MKHLDQFINEAKAQYELPENFEEKSKVILDDLVKLLPSYPGYKSISSFDRGYGGNGSFGYNPHDLVRYKAESAKRIGVHDDVFMHFDTKQIDVDKIKKAFSVIFGINVNEGIFDDNIDKKMPEYEWISKLHTGLSKFFKTNDLSKITLKESWNMYKPSIYKELEKLPTVQIGDYFVTLYSINIPQLTSEFEIQSITIQVFIYLNKDPEKIAAIKTANDAIKPYDVMARELKEGDLIAYVHIDSYGRLGGMRTGKIVSVLKDQVKLDIGKRINGNRTCLIARKDGKMIE